MKRFSFYRTAVRTASFSCVLWLAAPAVMAQGCEVTIRSGDAMRFDKASITVPASCQRFTVELLHEGKMPKTAMGHNWVLVRSSDVAAVTRDAMAAGAANDYLQPGDKRVIAHTKMLGGGESDKVSFDVSALDKQQEYTYFCSFPGHAALMKGSLRLGG